MERSTLKSGTGLVASMDQPSFKLRHSNNCDWISALPDEILVIILDKLAAKTVVSTSLLSQRWRHLWRFLQSFDLSEVSLPGNYIRVQLGPMREKYFSANKVHHFIESLRWFTRIGRDTALRKLSIVFSGSTECTDAVNSAIASATEHGVKEIDVVIVGHTEYQFPSWLFSGRRSLLLTSLCLSYCKLSVPLNFTGFSSLTNLVLITMHMSLKETQVLLRNCTNLQSLHLIGLSNIRILQLPKLKELILSWSTQCGTFKIDTPALQRMEYMGDVLPKSTFQSLPCLEHVSLRSFCDDHPDYHADELQNISTRFPRLKSLHLQYDVPKVRYMSSFEPRNGVVWDNFNFQHKNLKEVEMYNFTGRDNEISFARLLLCRAPNMRCMAFSEAPLRENVDQQLVPPNWNRGEKIQP